MSLLHSGGDESIALRSAAVGPSTQARLLQLVCGADADQVLQHSLDCILPKPPAPCVTHCSCLLQLPVQASA